MFAFSRPRYCCQETPTLTHLGDTYFYALMVLQGTAASAGTGAPPGAALVIAVLSG